MHEKMSEISDTINSELLTPFTQLLSDMQAIHSVLENVDYSKYLQFEPVTNGHFCGSTESSFVEIPTLSGEYILRSALRLGLTQSMIFTLYDSIRNYGNTFENWPVKIANL